MENYNLEHDVPVFYVTATSFPAGIVKAHERLHELAPMEGGRRFFGLSRPEQGMIVYKAAAEELSAGEGEALGCETMVIKKGRYISTYIKDLAKRPEQIQEAFQVLLADPRIQHEGGYCVEVYERAGDVRCMVRLRD